MGAKVGTYGRKTSSRAKKFTGTTNFGRLGERPNRSPYEIGSKGLKKMTKGGKKSRK